MLVGKSRTAVIALTLAGCAGDDGRLQIRASAVPLSATMMPSSERLADARAQLALGNVALALEVYRKAAREDPSSIEALSGMANCYELMGRFELTQRYMEQALALAPADPALLRKLAVSMRRQGRNDEAASVEQELSIRAASTTVPAAWTTDATRETEVKAAAVLTVRLPPARQGLNAGPRLQRLSFGEVALVTAVAPRWERDLAAERRRPDARTSSGAGFAGIRLLNAARHSGLAARTREMLLGRGWTSVKVGDFARPRSTSLILYSVRDERAARRLSADTGIALAGSPRPGAIAVVLGADWVERQRRGS